MSSKLTPREQRRIDTDDKILQAAIHQFGEKGFSSASLTDIAAEAGISQGLVSQRFESKEKLLEAAFKATPAASFFLEADAALPQTPQHAGSPADTLREQLLIIVKALRKEQRSDKRRFAFTAMLYTARDVPASFRKFSDVRFQKTMLPLLIKDAQTAGVLAKGDAGRLFSVFYRNALSLIRDCGEAGIPVPADESFLSILGLGEEVDGTAAGNAGIGAFVEQVRPAFRAIEGYLGLIRKHTDDRKRVADFAGKAELIATELMKTLEKLK